MQVPLPRRPLLVEGLRLQLQRVSTYSDVSLSCKIMQARTDVMNQENYHWDGRAVDKVTYHWQCYLPWACMAQRLTDCNSDCAVLPDLKISTFYGTA